MTSKRLLFIAAFSCFVVGGNAPNPVAAQIDSCTYVVMEAEGACPAINAEGTAVCRSCRPGQLCPPSLECISTTSSCVLRMLARVQGLQCGDCPLGANPLPPGFLCTETEVEPTETPEGGDETPTPTATGEGGETPTPTETEGGATATPTDGTGGTPTPTDGTAGTPTPTDGTGGTPTPTDGTGGTPTPTDGTGGTPTPTDGTGGTPTPTDGTGGTPTPTTSATTPSGGTATPTRTTVITPTATATAGTPAATRTATSGSDVSDGEGDDGCQAVASSHTAASWMIVIPVLGLLAWRRRQKR